MFMRRALVCTLLMALPSACEPATGTPVTATDAGPDAGLVSDGGSPDAGQSFGEASVVGTFGGQTLSAFSVTAALGINDQSYPNQVSVIIASIPNVCELLEGTGGQATPPNTQVLILVLGATEATSTVAPGTYTSAAATLQGQYLSNNSSCQESSTELTSGSVILQSAGTSYVGTFNVVFGPDTVTGMFSAPLCNVSASPGGDYDAGPLCASSG
jgi:hypothetical protein